MGGCRGRLSGWRRRHAGEPGHMYSSSGSRRRVTWGLVRGSDRVHGFGNAADDAPAAVLASGVAACGAAKTNSDACLVCSFYHAALKARRPLDTDGGDDDDADVDSSQQWSGHPGTRTRFALVAYADKQLARLLSQMFVFGACLFVFGVVQGPHHTRILLSQQPRFTSSNTPLPTTLDRVCDLETLARLAFGAIRGRLVRATKASLPCVYLAVPRLAGWLPSPQT